jgi:hypothetical protein
MKYLLIAIISFFGTIHSLHSDTQKEHVVFTDEKLLAMQNEIYQLLQKHSSQLENIATVNKPLVERWQIFLSIILPLQLQVLESNGLPNDQSSLSLFNEMYLAHAKNSKELFELNKKKWLFLYEKAFRVKEYKEITLEEAQSLIASLDAAMTSDEFLTQIDEAIKGKNTLLEKRQALLSVLFPLHMSVMEEYGFTGEAGYVQAQRSLMDYYSDPFIQEMANHAQSVVFQRAKLFNE